MSLGVDVRDAMVVDLKMQSARCVGAVIIRKLVRNVMIKSKVDEKGISIPFPQQDVHLYKQGN